MKADQSGVVTIAAQTKISVNGGDTSTGGSSGGGSDGGGAAGGPEANQACNTARCVWSTLPSEKGCQQAVRTRRRHGPGAAGRRACLLAGMEARDERVLRGRGAARRSGKRAVLSPLTKKHHYVVRCNT